MSVFRRDQNSSRKFKKVMVRQEHFDIVILE
mgnify:CR=1 FL=1